MNRFTIQLTDDTGGVVFATKFLGHCERVEGTRTVGKVVRRLAVIRNDEVRTFGAFSAKIQG